MSRPTSYQLLKDVYSAVNRLEDKFDKRIVKNEKNIDILEKKTEKMLGKIGVGVMLVSTIVTAAIALIGGWIRDLLRQ